MLDRDLANEWLPERAGLALLLQNHAQHPLAVGLGVPIEANVVHSLLRAASASVGWGHPVDIEPVHLVFALTDDAAADVWTVDEPP